MNSICRTKNIYKVLYDFDKEFFKKNGVTLNEAIVIYSLADKKSCSASNLSSSIGLSNSRASRILLGVEDKGYITRKIGKEDKRQMLFALTDSGEQKLIEIQDQESELIEFIALLSEHIEK